MSQRIRRARGGGYHLRLPVEERELLRSLPGQLQALIEAGDDPALERLFPPAYTGHPEHDAEYHRYMRDDLRDRHLDALTVMADTVDAERLDEEQLSAWLRALNELRLVLGSRLEVSEDVLSVPDDDPRAPGYALYGYLGWLQEQVVQTLRLS